MNRATLYRHQPGHEERSLFSYFRSIFQKYADRDFFFMGRTAAYFFFFALLFTLSAGAGDRSGYEWVLDETDRC